MKPVLCGMNNPLSADPRYALFPAPVGSTGHRIHMMLRERTGAWRSDYLRVFERVNALDSRMWDPGAARRQSGDLLARMAGRTVCLLGRAVLEIMWLNRVPPLVWQETDGCRWCYIPHPSGLNHWYNNTVHREAVALRLEQLYVDAGGPVRT